MGRSSRRRVRREHEVARDEALESTEHAAERVAARAEVADAILALEEPYREVVLMRYEQHLEPGAIAARLGRSPATVRSQLSRAHARLRERLDERFEGGTRAWAALLLRLPRASVGTSAAGLGSVLVSVAVGGVALTWVGFAIFGSSKGGSVAAPLEAPAHVLGADASSTALDAAPPKSSSARTPVAVALVQVSDESRPRFKDLDVESLRTLANQVRVELEAKLLSVPEHVASSAPRSRENAGVTRLLSGLGLESLANVTWSEGGGSYFSFATHSHDYQQQPDLSFQGGRFSSGFHGNALGFVLGLGGLPLGEVPVDGDRIPPGLPVEREDIWRMMCGELDVEGARSNEVRAVQHELYRTIPNPAPGQTYAVRAFSPCEHDYAWRVLRSWPVER